MCYCWVWVYLWGSAHFKNKTKYFVQRTLASWSFSPVSLPELTPFKVFCKKSHLLALNDMKAVKFTSQKTTKPMFLSDKYFACRFCNVLSTSQIYIILFDVGTLEVWLHEMNGNMCDVTKVHSCSLAKVSSVGNHCRNYEATWFQIGATILNSRILHWHYLSVFCFFCPTRHSTRTNF